jgi:hypothetical protein
MLTITTPSVSPNALAAWGNEGIALNSVKMYVVSLAHSAREGTL